MLKVEVFPMGTVYKRLARELRQGKVVVATSWGEPVAILIPTSAIDDFPEEARKQLKKIISDALLSSVGLHEA